MNIKIIVVDDNKITNRIIENILKADFKDKDVSAEFFTDGKSGLEYLTDPNHLNDYDIIILDGHIKAREDEEQIDGPLIAEKLKENKINKRVIIYTSDDDKAKQMSLFFDPPPPRLSKQLSRNSLKKVLIEEIEKLEKIKTEPLEKQTENLNLNGDEKNSPGDDVVSLNLSPVSGAAIR